MFKFGKDKKTKPVPKEKSNELNLHGYNAMIEAIGSYNEVVGQTYFDLKIFSYQTIRILLTNYAHVKAWRLTLINGATRTFIHDAGKMSPGQELVLESLRIELKSLVD